MLLIADGSPGFVQAPAVGICDRTSDPRVLASGNWIGGLCGRAPWSCLVGPPLIWLL